MSATKCDCASQNERRRSHYSLRGHTRGCNKTGLVSLGLRNHTRQPQLAQPRGMDSGAGWMGAGIPRARTCCFALPGMSIWPCAMCVHSARSLVCMAGAQSTEQCLMYMVPCAVQPTREQDRQCGGALQSTDAEPTERSVEHMLLLGHVLSLVLCVCVRMC